MRGEGAQALLDALLVADVGEDVLIDRQLGAILGGNVHARLRHQAEQPHRLERDRLAASVRTGNDDHPRLAVEPEVERNDLAGQQRVARLAQSQRPVVGDPWNACAGQAGIARLGQMQVNLRKQLDGQRQIRRVGGDQLGKLAQDALDLMALLGLQLTDAVVHLDDDQRLDEERRPRA